MNTYAQYSLQRNSKFRVCLKVQERADSVDVIKRPDAASLKDIGRFYLQVGYNEFFALGQSAWSGAPYFPTEKVKKKIDTAMNFVNNIGYVVKESDEIRTDKVAAQGEQLTSIVRYLSDVAKKEKIQIKQLWLDKIPAVIYLDRLTEKYSYAHKPFDINPIKITEHVYEDDKTYAFYLQIDGLANEKIEEAINAELKSQIIEFGQFAYDEAIKANSNDIYTSFGKYNRNEHYNYGDKPNNWNSCVKETILFNGNNVISIAMIDYDNLYLTKYSDSAVRFLNYNLLNGEKLKIEELFTKECSVADTFAKALYYQLGEGEIKWKENYYYNEITGEKEWWRI